MTTATNQKVTFHYPPESVGAMAFPEVVTHQEETSLEQVDRVIEELDAQKVRWRNLLIGEKIKLLDQVLNDLDSLGEEWVSTSLRAKGVHPGGFAEGEEWFMFGAVTRLLDLLRKSLTQTEKHGHPIPPGKIATRSNQQLVVPAFPTSFTDTIIFTQYHGETWMEPGVSEGEIFKVPPRDTGRVTLILGAGNTSISPIADVLNFLFVEGDVVVEKTYRR